MPAIIFKSKDERDLLKRVTKRLLDNKELNKDIIFQIIELWASLFKAEKIKGLAEIADYKSFLLSYLGERFAKVSKDLREEHLMKDYYDLISILMKDFAKREDEPLTLKQKTGRKPDQSKKKPALNSYII